MAAEVRTVRFAPVPSHTIPGIPLELTAEVREWIAEAVRELGLEGREPPAMWLIELEDLRGVADLGGERGALGIYAHTRGEDPVIGLQNGLPPFVLRSVIRHELCHWRQDLEGRGEWWSGVTTRGEPIEGLWISGARQAANEDEAEAFQFDARYRADAEAAGAVAPPGWRYEFGRLEDGNFGWRKSPSVRIHLVGAFE